MLTLAILSQKGGAGKTTLSFNLAIAAEQDHQTTVLIDLDPQASATQIGDMREADAPSILSVQATRLTNTLEAATDNGAQIAIIDTAPHSERDALAATKAANLVLIPCRPTILDLNAIKRTVELVELAKTPALGILSAVPPVGKAGEEAIEVLKHYGLPYCPTPLIQRAAYMHALTCGMGVLEYEPKGKAAHEVKQVYKFVKKHVNKLVCQHAYTKELVDAT
ncbi:MAG: AAA family ATPase [Chloroflexota bacterium]